ncbi:hypothetical protein TNCV_3944551 [Trichonephila clavipes]|nr:hypothetical protein TNCV_3944551 [Trichonephila clavipes]
MRKCRERKRSSSEHLDVLTFLNLSSLDLFKLVFAGPRDNGHELVARVSMGTVHVCAQYLDHRYWKTYTQSNVIGVRWFNFKFSSLTALLDSLLFTRPAIFAGSEDHSDPSLFRPLELPIPAEQRFAFATEVLPYT